ncbi:hypothetical protein AXG93_2190s1090 [Marchantia polymorpha subsp. ruderalis]|uniref:Uncharacterized protein n=1 Tax=Marchantia polymorpha subsp. ruderalis TaxID=1480154 RepID=A0A176WGT3_MARPO|nr:hypothetical protein AXG93_2190s1090 [Marchantia polymorpha subsp. ruderalis]
MAAMMACSTVAAAGLGSAPLSPSLKRSAASTPVFKSVQAPMLARRLGSIRCEGVREVVDKATKKEITKDEVLQNQEVNESEKQSVFGAKPTSGSFYPRPEVERRPETGDKSIGSIFAFDGAAPETINGRLGIGLIISWWTLWGPPDGSPTIRPYASPDRNVQPLSVEEYMKVVSPSASGYGGAHASTGQPRGRVPGTVGVADACGHVVGGLLAGVYLPHQGPARTGGGPRPRPGLVGEAVLTGADSRGRFSTANPEFLSLLLQGPHAGTLTPFFQMELYPDVDPGSQFPVETVGGSPAPGAAPAPPAPASGRRRRRAG